MTAALGRLDDLQIAPISSALSAEGLMTASTVVRVSLEGYQLLGSRLGPVALIVYHVDDRWVMSATAGARYHHLSRGTLASAAAAIAKTVRRWEDDA